MTLFKCDKKGFTYLEILVSTAVLFFVLFFFMQLNKYNHKVRAQSDEESKMSMVVQGVIDAYRKLGKDQALAYAQGYTVIIDEDTNTGHVGLKKVIVTVLPKISGMSSIKFATYQTAEATGGGGDPGGGGDTGENQPGNGPNIPNTPDLAQNMTPIKWNGTSWIDTTTSDKDWYDYRTTAKKWANARTSDGSMYVWIPRYTYKITYINPSDRSLGGTIDIIFSNGTIDDCSNLHLTHPAFNFGGYQLKGIWFGKFEGSNDGAGKISVKPAQYSYEKLSIGQYFTKCINIKTERNLGTLADTHMEKSGEWGAAAYLATAIGTKPAHSAFIGTKTVDFTEYYLGTRTGGSNSVSTVFTTNVNESTTGNAYGIYDMNGTLPEYAASYIDNGNISSSTNGLSIINANAKYKEVFQIGSPDSSNNNFSIAESMSKGMALNETANELQQSWDSSYIDEVQGGYIQLESSFPSLDSPFILRFGSSQIRSGMADDRGIFQYSCGDGAGINEFNETLREGSRPVIAVTGEGSEPPPLDTTPPGQVTSLAETHGATSVSLSWVKPIDTDFSKVKIYRDNVYIGETVANTYTNSGLTSNTSYTYRVTTVDTSGNESTGVTISITTPVDNTPPGQVTSLTETHGTTTVELKWINPTDSDFSKVKIYRNNVCIAEIASNAYIDSGLTPGTTYTYRITTVDTTGNESTGITISVSTRVNNGEVFVIDTLYSAVSVDLLSSKTYTLTSKGGTKLSTILINLKNGSSFNVAIRAQKIGGVNKDIITQSGLAPGQHSFSIGYDNFTDGPGDYKVTISATTQVIVEPF